MFIVSAVRSGGTAYAIAKAAEMGIPFGGDLNYTQIAAASSTQPNIKALYHETGIGHTFTPSEYVNIHLNLDTPAFMYLVPANVYNIADWDKAQAYVCRRNIKNIARSVYCYTTKVNKDKRIVFQGEMFPAIMRALMGAACLLEYCKQRNKPVTWYEDVFDVSTEYKDYNESPYFAQMDPLIDKFLSEVNFQQINPNIVLT